MFGAGTLGVCSLIEINIERHPAFISLPAAHKQMLAINVFRAMENNVPIIRPTPTGITAIIDPRGKVVSKVRNTGGVEVNITGYVSGEVELKDTGTFYTRHGDWIILPMALFTLPLVIGGMIIRIREKRNYT